MAGRYGLEIRSATAADASGVAELMRSAGLAVTSRAMVDRIEALRQETGALLLASEWGPPSGVIAVTWRRSLLADAPTAQITTLLVEPQARRRGLARLLLKAAAQAARAAGCSALQLHAPPEHPNLAAFCRATGFVGAGERFERALRRRG